MQILVAHISGRFWRTACALVDASFFELQSECLYLDCEVSPEGIDWRRNFQRLARLNAALRRFEKKFMRIQRLAHSAT